MKRLVLALAIIAGTAFVSVPANADGEITPTEPTASSTSDTTDTGAETQLGEPAESTEQELVLDPAEGAVVPTESSPPAEKLVEKSAPAQKKSAETTELAAADDDVSTAAADGGNVKICHATVAETNPYVLPPPSTSGDGAGHLSHSLDSEGNPLPIWYPGAKDDGVVWGDIIQPFPDVPGLENGLNWDNGGQQVAENGCEIPTGPATPPSVLGGDCDNPGTLVIPDDNPALEYTVVDNGDGTVTVTVVAIGPFIITGPTEWTLEIEAQQNCVTPLAPSVSDPTCDAPGLVTVTPVEGVNYDVVDNGDGTFTVTATAEDGYVITPGAQTEWIVEVGDQLNCVTPLEPSVTPADCDNPGAVVPADGPEGVTYEVIDNGDGTFSVEASVETGYVFEDGVQTEFGPYEVEEQWDCVSPVEPSAIDPTCEDAGDVDLPTTEGVVYTLVSIIEGVATVEATPADGYHFEDGVENPTVYEIEVDEQLNCVGTEPGVVTEATCDAAGDFQPVTTEGVVYTRVDNGDGTVTITAEAADGFVLFDDAETEWTEEIEPQLNCVVPEVVDATCEDAGIDGYVITEVEGVIYDVVQGEGITVIHAEAAEGYTIEPGAQTSWTFEPNVCGEVVEKDPPKLPNTGAPSMAYLWFGFLMTAAGGYLVTRRRQVI